MVEYTYTRYAKDDKEEVPDLANGIERMKENFNEGHCCNEKITDYENKVVYLICKDFKERRQVPNGFVVIAADDVQLEV